MYSGNKNIIRGSFIAILSPLKSVSKIFINSFVYSNIVLSCCCVIGEISFHMLKDSFIDVYKVEEGLSVKEVIEKYQNNQITQITTSTHSVEESQIEKTQ